MGEIVEEDKEKENWFIVYLERLVVVAKERGKNKTMEEEDMQKKSFEEEIENVIGGLVGEVADKRQAGARVGDKALERKKMLAERNVVQGR